MRAAAGERTGDLLHAGVPLVVRSERSRWVSRGRRGPIGGAGGTDAHAERLRAEAGCRGEAQWVRCTAAARRGASGPAGPRVDGALRAPAWAACAARVRRCVRILSITEACVINATIRIAPWQAGHARGVDLKDLLQERRPPAAGLLRENADAIEQFAAHEDATFLALAFVAPAG